MILKQLRLSRQLSQEQMALMAGLNVRTIQRLESGHKASLESLKCLAAVLEVDVATLNQESFVMDKQSDNWQKMPVWLKAYFVLGTYTLAPTREVMKRIEVLSHVSGFTFCLLGFVSEAALAGGLIMLTNAYTFSLLKWLGDKYAVW